MAKRLSKTDLCSVVDEGSSLLSEQEQEVSPQMNNDYGTKDGQRPREDGEREGGLDNDRVDTAMEDGHKAPENIALKKCGNYVITPYFFLLGILGWRMFKQLGWRRFKFISESLQSKIQWILRVFLVIFWSLLITATFSTQIVTCFTRDKISIGQSSNDTVLFVDCRKHVITTYPTFILMIYSTYFFGIYLFSHGGDQQIIELSEKVFILALKLKQKKKNLLILTMIAFLIGGAVWIVIALALNIMTAVAFDMFNSTVEIKWPTGMISHTEKRGLIIFSLIGFSIFDVVYIAAVINYAAQSELLIDLLKVIKMLVEKGFQDENDGYKNITTAMKDIEKARKFLRTLNRGAATSTAFILFNLGSNIVLSVINMDNIVNPKHNTDYINRDLATAASFLNVLLWLALMVVPLVQATRVSYTCGRLKETGAFIYTNSNNDVQSHRQNMDMYSNFLQSLTLRATLFGVPIYPWMMYGTLTATVFVILILFQTDIYSLWYVL